MYAYKEIITLDDPQHLTLSRPLPLQKGQQVEVLVIAVTDSQFDAETQLHRDAELLRSISEQSQMTEEQAFELSEEISQNIWNRFKGKVLKNG